MDYLRQRLIDYLRVLHGSPKEKIIRAKWEGEFLYKLSQYFRVHIYSDCPDVNLLGGLDIHAGSIVPALAVSNYINEFSPIKSVILRGDNKNYDLRGSILNHIRGDNLDSNKNLIVVQDYVDNKANSETSSEKLFQTCKFFHTQNYKVLKAVVIVQDTELNILRINLRNNFCTILKPIILTSELL